MGWGFLSALQNVFFSLKCIAQNAASSTGTGKLQPRGHMLVTKTLILKPVLVCQSTGLTTAGAGRPPGDYLLLPTGNMGARQRNVCLFLGVWTKKCQAALPPKGLL